MQTEIPLVWTFLLSLKTPSQYLQWQYIFCQNQEKLRVEWPQQQHEGPWIHFKQFLLSHEKHDFCTSMSRIHWKIVNCHSSLALFTSDTTSIWGFCCHSSHQHVSLQRHVINFYDDEMEINPQAMGNTNTFNNAWSNSSLPHSWDFVLLNEREGGRNPIFEYFVSD